MFVRSQCPPVRGVRQRAVFVRSHCPSVLAVRRFLLSVRSQCPSVRSVRPFVVSVRSQCPSVLSVRRYVGTGPRYDECICKAWSGHAHRNMRWRRRTPSKKDHMKRKFKIPARATPSSLRSSSEGVRSECSEARRPARSLHRQGISRIPRRAAPQVVCAAE